MKRLIKLLTVASILSLCCSAYAGIISTNIKDSLGRSQQDVFANCIIAGENTNGVDSNTGLPNTARTGSSATGVIYMPGLNAGTYSLGLSEKRGNEAIYRKNIVVPVSGDCAYFEMNYAPLYYMQGNQWFDSWGHWYAQSFKATNSCSNLISIGLKAAGAMNGGSNCDIDVAILDGDTPYASQIGPTRKLGWNGMDMSAAYWSAGEIPLVPGRTYTVKFTAGGGAGSLSPFHQTIRRQMISDNPDGRTWVDGIELTEPLDMTVNVDDAGMVNSMCCARTSGTWTWFQNYAGQTFTAKGTSVLMLTWLTGANSLWKISIHNYNQQTQTYGAQIGPAKYVYGIAYDNRSVVTWAPGEVPVTAGNKYYIRMQLVSADPNSVIYNAFYSDEYAGGQAFADGAPQIYDYAIAVYEEKSSGALDQTRVGISSFRVESITTSSAIVKWTPSKLADGLVEWGETTPYTNSKYNSGKGFTQSISITGLKPNTMYHVRGMSKATSSKDGYSKDLVFVTLSANSNLLADPGFESGAFGTWTKYGLGDLRITTTGWIYGAGPHSGTYAFAGAGMGNNEHGGVYQRVPAIPGAEYRLSSWIWTYISDGNLFTALGNQTQAKIGFDPYGGTNTNSSNIQWTPVTSSQNAYMQIAKSVVAQSNHITVFLYGGMDTGTGGSAFAFDDTALTTDTVPTDTDLLTAMKDTADGTLIKFGNVTCTATTSQAGAYYVENSDRYKGIRVETTESMSVGNLITITGKILTKPSGERYIEAYLLSPSTGTAIEPLLISCKNLGGSALGNCQAVGSGSGPYNVGLLVRIAGSVKAIIGNTIWVNDGSIDGNGVKVQVSSLPSGTVVGSNVGISGILQLEGTAPSATVLVRATEVNLF